MMFIAALVASWRPALLATVVAALAIAFVASRSRPMWAVAAPRFEATQIADAVLFNEGPAARRLTVPRREPMVWDNITRELRVRINTAIAADPLWSGKFAAGMQSGEPEAVAAATAQLAVLVGLVLNKWLAPNQMARWKARLAREWIAGQLVLSIVLLAENLAMEQDWRSRLLKEIVIRDLAAGLRASG
jgi:hypothetical protein